MEKGEIMKKIDLIQVLKSVVKKCWFPVLLAAIGASVMFFMTKMQQNQSVIIWTLKNRYVISLSDHQDYDSYLYEEKMAAVINDLLSQDEELTEMRSTFSTYLTRVFYRRIELSIQSENKERLMQAEDLFLEKAQTYLTEEFAQAATIALESTVVQEETPVNVTLPKKTILLGALLGLCTGLSIILIIEYVKSPTETIAEKEGNGK